MTEVGEPTSGLFDVSGRVALVTGASSGLGAAVARALAGGGAHVALAARRKDRLDDLAREIGGTGFACDLLDQADLEGLVERVVAGCGPPDILVNAAGHIVGGHRAEDEPLDAVLQTLQLNLVAPFRLSQQVFPHMRARGGGAIVFVSSISGHVGVPGIPQASYAASKFALSGLTKELATQWARHSIRVNTVAPGFFRSEITESLYADDKGQAWLRRGTALPYDAEPQDMVGAVLWLVSDAGRFATGQTVVVDGGWTAR
jgi:NAD(P)-dependent dehydrogenase (short-subunit alcohol dehydrogenase family)